MKKCFKCNELQPLSEFYRHPRMADGHFGKCKRCVRAYQQERAHSHPEVHRAWLDREAAEGRPRRSKYSAARRRLYAVVHRAVRRGEVVKPEVCEVAGCERVDIEAHHPDYSRPLQVVWVCRTHHRAIHRIDPDRRPAIG